jgi:bisdemethoxycurcumin synthase
MQVTGDDIDFHLAI